MGLSYNGISLTNLVTNSVNHEPIMDPSGTDQLFTKITFTVSALFHINPTNSANLAPVLAGETPAATMARVRHMLMQPRQSLLYDPTGDVNFLRVVVDDANGPIPIYCRVKEVTPVCWHIEYSVSVSVVDCTDGSRPYLSLRWSDSTSYDADWLCTKTRTGTLILSSWSGFVPDAYRFLITPAVPKRFRRVSAEYRLDETNLRLSFTFVDKERMKNVPIPALKMTGKQVETAPMGSGLRVGQLSIRMTGDRTCDPNDLVKMCIYYGMTRVYAAGVQTAQDRLLFAATVEENLDDSKCEISLHLEWKIKPDKNRMNVQLVAGGVGIGGAVIKNGKNVAAVAMNPFPWVGVEPRLPPGQNDRGITMPLFGTASAVGLFAAILNDPCGSALNPIDYIQAQENVLVGQGEQGEVTIKTGTVYGGQDIACSFGTDNTPGVYDSYLITSHYNDDPGVAVMPSTKAGDLASVVATHAGLLTLNVEWTASRVGGVPTIPSPRPSSADAANVIYLGGTISPEGLDLAADGVSVKQTRSGIYRYAFLNKAIAPIAAAIPPFLDWSELSTEAPMSSSELSADIHFPAAQGSGVDLFGSEGGGAELIGGGPPLGGDIPPPGGLPVYP